jgi:hypothetical protein
MVARFIDRAVTAGGAAVGTFLKAQLNTLSPSKGGREFFD